MDTSSLNSKPPTFLQTVAQVLNNNGVLPEIQSIIYRYIPEDVTSTCYVYGSPEVRGIPGQCIEGPFVPTELISRVIIKEDGSGGLLLCLSSAQKNTVIQYLLQNKHELENINWINQAIVISHIMLYDCDEWDDRDYYDNPINATALHIVFGDVTSKLKDTVDYCIEKGLCTYNITTDNRIYQKMWTCQKCYPNDPGSVICQSCYMNCCSQHHDFTTEIKSNPYTGLVGFCDCKQCVPKIEDVKSINFL